MRLRRFPVAFAVAFVPAFALAQETDAEKVIALGRVDNRVMEHLDHLSNRIGPRLTGSDAFRNACEWARERFEEYGLQNARLEEWGTFPVGFNRGPSSGRMVSPEKKELHFATNAWTAGTRGPVAGPVVIAPTNEEELAAARPKLKGAWVLSAPTSPARPERRPQGGPEAAGPSGPREGRPAEAASAGAGSAAPEESSRGGARSPAAGASASRAFRDLLEKAYEEQGVLGTIRASRGELIHTGGNSRIAFDKLPNRASITLLASEHKEILDRVKAGEDVRLEFEVRNWFEKGPIPLHNVLAEIPGSEKPDEVVIVGGHLDSWDGATGTTDNGTGCATTIEAARLLVKAGVRPKRTIRFMLWGGEEQGLLGSRAYVEKHKDEMTKVSAVLVHDGGTNYCAGLGATPPMVKPFEEVFAPVKDLDPEMPFKVRQVNGLSGGGSDHASFLAANVPGFFWDQKGRANYNRTHHTQYDTYDAAIPEYQKNSAIVIAVGALGIANLPDLLSRENLRAPGGGFGGRRLGIMPTDDLTIEELTEDGLAAKAGLKVGDRVVKIGDRMVGDTTEMREALREGPAKTTVTVLRAGKEVTAEIEFPADSGPAGGMGRRFGMRLGETLTIDGITPGGVADQAGLQAGDRIVKVGNTAVATAAELFPAFAAAEVQAKIVVLRDGKEVTITVAIPERP